MKPLERALAAVIAGDVRSLFAVVSATHSELTAAAEMIPNLSVSRGSVVRILETWRSGACSDVHVQQWASFVKRGYVDGRTGPTLPIDIPYDADDEDMIVEIVGRFDELGDEIDGVNSTRCCRLSVAGISILDRDWRGVRQTLVPC